MDLNADVIVWSLPFGYRWATAFEAANFRRYHHKMVQVRVGGTDSEPFTDLAIRI